MLTMVHTHWKSTQLLLTQLTAPVVYCVKALAPEFKGTVSELFSEI